MLDRLRSALAERAFAHAIAAEATGNRRRARRYSDLELWLSGLPVPSRRGRLIEVVLKRLAVALIGGGFLLCIWLMVMAAIAGTAGVPLDLRRTLSLAGAIFAAFAIGLLIAPTGLHQHKERRR